MQKPSFFKQIGFMIAKPGKLFDTIKEKPLILLPVLIAVIGGLFNGFSAAKAVNSMDITSLPVQARNVMQGGLLQSMGTLSIITSPVVSVIALFFNALLFWVLSKILKGKGSYMQSVSMIGIANYPFMIRDILRYFFAEPGLNSYNIKAMTEVAKIITFDGVFLTVLGTVGIIFLIWVLILMTKGFKKVFEVKAVKAAVMISIIFIAGMLIQAGITFAGYQAMLNVPAINMGG